MSFQRGPWREAPWSHPRRIGRIVRSVCRRAPASVSAEVVEDCLQEAQLSIWEARHRLEGLPEPEREPYAATCARHAAGRLLRKESILRQRHVPIVHLEETLTAANPQPWDDPEDDRWLTNLQCEATSRGVAALPERDRTILHYYYAHGMTDREIADRLGCTLSAVEQQRSRLIRRLRRAAAEGALPANAP